MPTATAKSSHHRRILPTLPPPSAEDLKRLQALADDPTEPVPDEDSPDVTLEPGRFVVVAPPHEVLRIPRTTLSWFGAHGGNAALNRVLRAYIKDQAIRAGKGKRSVAQPTRRRASGR